MIRKFMIGRLLILGFTLGPCAVGQSSGASWRDSVRRAVENARVLGGVPIQKEALNTSTTIGPDGSLRLESIRWDPLHRLSVLALRSEGKHPLIVTTTQQLSIAAKSGRVTKQHAPLLLTAGSSCKVTVNDGLLHMSLEGKALSSAIVGQIARVRLVAGNQRILRVVPTALGEVEVLP